MENGVEMLEDGGKKEGGRKKLSVSRAIWGVIYVKYKRTRNKHSHNQRTGGQEGLTSTNNY